MVQSFDVRPARPEDMPSAYAVFRRALYDYLFRLKMVDAATAQDPPVASAWKRQGEWIEHFWNSAAENWVAVDSAGAVVGWALSVERGGHLELTHFFVEPGYQSTGIGRALLGRAFPQGRAPHRSIVATQDERALALYLRQDIAFVTSSFDIIMKGRAISTTHDLVLAPAREDDASAWLISNIEERVLGFRREADISFLLRNRPAWIALRGDEPVGYAFGVQPVPPDVSDFHATCGPMAALDPADVPALLDHVISSAQDGLEFSVAVPMANRAAITCLLAGGGRIDPFFIAVLSSEPTMKLDRYIHTSPTFIL